MGSSFPKPFTKVASRHRKSGNILEVQLRGCSLKGTDVERELELLASTTESPELEERANSIFEDIDKDRKMPEDFDSLGPGACKEQVRH